MKNKATGEVILETFSPSVVAALNNAKYEAVPILLYLAGINEALKARRCGTGHLG